MTNTPRRFDENPNTTTNLQKDSTEYFGISQSGASKVIKTSDAFTKANVGLSEVDNTSDTNKPVSVAQQTALDLKADKSELLTLGEVTGTAYDGAKGKANADNIATVDSRQDVILENKVINGDFADGTDNISIVSIGVASISVTDRILHITGGGASGAPRVFTTNSDLLLKEGDVIFGIIKAKITNSDCSALRFGLTDTNSTGITQSFKDISSPVINTDYYIYNNLTVQGGYTGNLRFVFQHSYATNILANGKDMEVDGNYGVFGLNLTDIFCNGVQGTGNEPSAEFMKLLVETVGFFNLHTMTNMEILKVAKELSDLNTSQSEVLETKIQANSNTIEDYHTVKNYSWAKTYDVDSFNVAQGFSVYDAFATLLNSVKFDASNKQSEVDAFDGYSHDSTLALLNNIGYSVFVSNLVEDGDNPTYDHAIVTLSVVDFSTFTSESLVTSYEVAKQGDTIGAYTITSGAGVPNCYIVGTVLHIIFSAKLSDGNWYLIHQTFDTTTNILGTAETCNLTINSTTYDYTTANVNAYIPTTPIMYDLDTFISQNSQIAYYDGYYYTGMCVGQQIYSSVIMRTADLITWEVWLKPTWANDVRAQYEGSCTVFNNTLYYAMRLSENENSTNGYINQKMLVAKIDLTTKAILQEVLITGAYSRACWYTYEGKLHLFHSIQRRHRSEDINFINGDLTYPQIVMQGTWEYIYPSFVVADDYVAISCTGVGPNRVRLHKWIPDNYSVTTAINTLASMLNLDI